VVRCLPRDLTGFSQVGWISPDSCDPPSDQVTNQLPSADSEVVAHWDPTVVRKDRRPQFSNKLATDRVTVPAETIEAQDDPMNQLVKEDRPVVVDDYVPRHRRHLDPIAVPDSVIVSPVAGHDSRPGIPHEPASEIVVREPQRDPEPVQSAG